jgi:hypothetical protein
MNDMNTIDIEGAIKQIEGIAYSIDTDLPDRPSKFAFGLNIKWPIY